MTLIDRPRAAALLAAGTGAAAFVAIGLPLPLLLGPMLGGLGFALAGVELRDTGLLGTLMRTFLGVAVGASITPELVGELAGYGPTLLMVPVFVALVAAAGYPLFRRVYGFDHPTAWYAAMPGGLQDMLIFGEEAGGNVRTMSLIHATRVLVIVTVAPFVLTLLYDLDLAAPPGQSAAAMPVSQIAIMLAAGLVGWRVAARVGLFGASIMGPLILTAALSLAGVVQSRPPAEMIWAAQFFIGLSIGAKYSGITRRELSRDVGAGLLYSAILAVLSLAYIELVLLVSPAETLDVILAFLPGGQAEMAIIAIVAGADVAFVVAHHLVRIILVITLSPVISARVRR